MPESEWRAPCYKGRRNACRRKREAAAAERRRSFPFSSSSERSEPETMQIGVTALGRTGTAAQNNINPPVTTWREWAFGTVGKGKRRKRRSAAYKSRKRNRRRH